MTSSADHRRWRRDYLRTVIPETLVESDHTVDHQRLARLLDGIAGIAGHELVLGHLVSDLAIDRRTAARYLDLLEEMRLIRRLPGLRMKATDTERAVPKLHMVDPILVAPDPPPVSTPSASATPNVSAGDSSCTPAATSFRSPPTPGPCPYPPCGRDRPGC